MMKEKVFIGKSTTPRKKLKQQIELSAFFDGVKNGKWKNQVLKARTLFNPLDNAKYSKHKLGMDAVWLHHLPLMVVDWESNKIPEKLKPFVFAFFESVSGKGYALILRLPDMPNERYAAYRKLIQGELDMPANEGQIHNDRCRYVSYDKHIKVNWDAQCYIVTTASKEATVSSAEDYYINAKNKLVGLDNDMALSVYSWLRNKSKSHDDVVAEMETLLYNSVSLKTSKLREVYYDKWEKQYEFPPTIKNIKSSVIVVKPEKIEAAETETVYCNEDDQVFLMVQAALSAFLPLQIDYFGERISVNNSIVLVGKSSSGKGKLNNVVTQLHKIAKPIIPDLRNEALDRYTGVSKIKQVPDNEVIEIKKAEKVLPHIFIDWSFQGSEAALLASLSEYDRCIVHTTEISVASAAVGAKHNASLLGTLLQLVEGELVSKSLKRQDTFGKTMFEIENAKVAMLIGGTPDHIVSYFRDKVSNGLVGRLTFVEIGSQITDKKYNIPKLETYIDSEMIKNVCTGAQESILVKYDKQFVKDIKIKLKTEYEDYILFDLVDRGIRECIKRAAVKLWMQGSRKEAQFNVTKEMIEEQMIYMYRSFHFIESFQDSKVNWRGDSILNEQVETARLINIGKISELKNGVALSKKNIEFIKSIYDECKSFSKTAKITGVSRPTVKRYCK
jgi:hypothetical protein